MVDTDAADVNDGGLPPASSAANAPAVSISAVVTTAATFGGSTRDGGQTPPTAIATSTSSGLWAPSGSHLVTISTSPSTAGFAGGRPATTGEYPSATSGAGGQTPATGGVGGSLTTGDGTPTVFACVPETSGALGMPTIIDGATIADHGPHGTSASLIATPFMTLGIAPGDGDRLPAPFGMHFYYNFLTNFTLSLASLTWHHFLLAKSKTIGIVHVCFLRWCWSGDCLCLRCALSRRRKTVECPSVRLVYRQQRRRSAGLLLRSGASSRYRMTTASAELASFVGVHSLVSEWHGRQARYCPIFPSF